MSKMGGKSGPKVDKKGSAFVDRFLQRYRRGKVRKNTRFSGRKKEGFLIKCRPVCERPSLEQTLAGRIRTKGSDVWKMLFFVLLRAEKWSQNVDRKKREQVRKN